MNKTLAPPPNSAITPEEWQQTPANVRNWIGELVADNHQLRETVGQLQEILNRNSQNSSQPPSQDRPEQNQSKIPPVHHANAVGNRVIAGIIEYWLMAWMK